MKKIIIILAVIMAKSIFAQDTLSVDSTGGINATQVIIQNSTIKFSNLQMSKDNASGELSAIITFSRVDKNNSILEMFTISKKGEEFNEFWRNWNSGKYLFQQLNLKDGSGNLIDIPESIESTFFNQ